MAAIPVTIVGIDQQGNPTTIVGMMSYTGLQVGGGPMPGGGGAHPSHPINLPGMPSWEGPVDPGYGWPIEGPPRPAHPIVIPPDKPLPPEGDGSRPSQPIYIPGESGPGGVHVLFGVFLPGSGQGVTYFLVPVQPPPTTPQPKT